MSLKQALWILEHQIGPNVYGLKWHAVTVILDAHKPKVAARTKPKQATQKRTPRTP